MKKRIVAALASVLISKTPVLAQTAIEMNQTLDQLFGEHKPYADFLTRLQKAIAASDKESIAELIDYPLQIKIGGKAVKIKDKQHFVTDYDEVITQTIKDVVAKQTYATLFVNWQGAAIGDGKIWFSSVGKNKKIRVTAIND
ncbi:hypothetical protein [Beijerinckia indica]|nr:hypothetical protein [Beijerinckia indica]